MRWRLFRWCLVGVLGCALASSAEGRVPEGPDEARGRKAAAEAKRAYSEGRKEEAVTLFREAWKAYKAPMTLCNLAKAEADLGRARDAAQNLTMCLRLLPPSEKGAIGERLGRELKKALALVGTLNVAANVPDAEVRVNGEVVATLPLMDPIFVDPGSHGVEVRAPGYEPDAKLAVVHAGSTLYLKMHLETMRTEVAPPRYGELPAEPKKEAILPPPVAPVPPAKAPPPKSLPVSSKAAEPTGEPVRAAVIVGGFGLGVAGVAVGTAALMAASAAREDADLAFSELTSISPQVCTLVNGYACLYVDATREKATVLTAVGVAGFAAAAAGGALIAYELIRSTPQRKDVSMQARVVTAPGGGVLKVTGTF